ncbi:MAG: LysM peptidoglycan-binding domain-containing protein, partial [Alistipes timonensis]|nr:LysM peptidoglycan-binding domain-containing protein [Alistipes timonensis]
KAETRAAEAPKAAPAKAPAPKKEQPKKARAEKKQSTYTVRSGDTLYAIAKKHKTTIQALQKANGLKKNAKLRPGQKLKLK